MLTVTILSNNQRTMEAGIPFELVSKTGQVLSSGTTDVHGVVTFDVDPEHLDHVGVRLDTNALDKLTKS
jgi:hypothetical protein